MSFRNWFAPFVASGFFGVIAVGCSGSSGGPSGPAPADAASEVVGRRLFDDAGPTGGDDGGDDGGAFDQTTGKTCVSDKDCASAGGPGVNACSKDFTGTLNGVKYQLFATPVCLPPPTSLNCDPVASPFCDGPNSTQAAGFCLAVDSKPQAGRGLCYPKCTFGLDGSKATGCAGTNVCNPAYVLQGPPVVGIGYCTSACQADSDCTAFGPGYGCQSDIGLCVAKKSTRTKALGESCTAATDGGVDDNTTGACNCASGASGAGFCSSVCVTGGAPCPNGWVCDAGQLLATYSGVTLSKQNTGVAGVCMPPCLAIDGGTPAMPAVADGGMGADATADGAAVSTDAGSPGPSESGAASQCPGTLKCQSMTLAGPNCSPP